MWKGTGIQMKFMKLQLAVKEDFEPGQCYDCLLYNKEENNCILCYRNVDCPLKEVNGYEEDYNSANG